MNYFLSTLFKAEKLNHQSPGTESWFSVWRWHQELFSQAEPINKNANEMLVKVCTQCSINFNIINSYVFVPALLQIHLEIWMTSEITCDYLVLKIGRYTTPQLYSPLNFAYCNDRIKRFPNATWYTVHKSAVGNECIFFLAEHLVFPLPADVAKWLDIPITNSGRFPYWNWTSVPACFLFCYRE